MRHASHQGRAHITIGVLGTGKVLIDIANPLDFSNGFPPRSSVCNDDSLAERIQCSFPNARVFTTLNTMTTAVMCDRSLVPREHTMFICGSDEKSKTQVVTLLGEWFGLRREQFFDLGDLRGARAIEMNLSLWLRIVSARGNTLYNVAVVAGGADSGR